MPDEKIQLLSNNGMNNVCISQCEAFKTKNFVPTLEHGGGGIMLCNWFTASGNWSLLKRAGIMKEQS